MEIRISDVAKRAATENGWTHFLYSRAHGKPVLCATSLEQAQDMLTDGSVDVEEDCIIVPAQ